VSKYWQSYITEVYYLDLFHHPMITACWKFVVLSFHLSNTLINKVLCSYIMKYAALTIMHHTIMPILFHWKACKAWIKGQKLGSTDQNMVPRNRIVYFPKIVNFLNEMLIVASAWAVLLSLWTGQCLCIIRSIILLANKRYQGHMFTG